MLTQITISQFTVVEQLDVELQGGLTVVTGETGAGKSILLDALGLCLGDRADPKTVRPGQDRAEIHIRFNVEALDSVLQWLQERDLDAGDELLLRRVINTDGRSRAYINGRPATLQDCSALGEQLVDIHGQHAHQTLLRRSRQRQLLDSYAGCQDTAAEVEQLALQWRACRDELTSRSDQQREHADREQLLRYQLAELDTLALGEGELAALETEQRRLGNAETIQLQAARAIELCEQSGQEVRAALGELDPSLHDGKSIDDVRAMLESASIQIEEARSELQQYLADREASPERLAEVESRLEGIYSQARKHRILPEQLTARHAEIRREFEALDSSDERVQELEAQLEKLSTAYRENAAKLAAARRAAGQRLQHDVNGLLENLAMGGSLFEVGIATRSGDEPHPNGSESVEFLVSTNPGAPPQALNKVASGGELSRISLAVQVVCADASPVPTMLFDEVDVGIGGAVAEIVGRMLAEMAQRAQLLCVTHLPQVASQGRQHVLVEKNQKGQRVSSSLRALGGDERIQEIARMLGGVNVTEQTLAHAQEMLDEAARRAVEQARRGRRGNSSANGGNGKAVGDQEDDGKAA